MAQRWTGSGVGLLHRMHRLRLLVGLLLPHHVDGGLARYCGGVGDRRGQGVVGPAVALVSTPAFPAWRWGRLVDCHLVHLWVCRRCRHWAVALELPQGLAVMAGRGLEARVRVHGLRGDMIAAIGAPVVVDPVDTLGLARRGGGAPVLAWWVGALVLVRGADLADAHGFACQPHRGHGHRALPPRRGLLMGSGGVPGRWVGGLGGGRVMGLVDLLLGLDEFGVPGGQ